MEIHIVRSTFHGRKVQTSTFSKHYFKYIACLIQTQIQKKIVVKEQYLLLFENLWNEVGYDRRAKVTVISYG